MDFKLLLNIVLDFKNLFNIVLDFKFSFGLQILLNLALTSKYYFNLAWDKWHKVISQNLKVIMTHDEGAWVTRHMVKYDWSKVFIK